MLCALPTSLVSFPIIPVVLNYFVFPWRRCQTSLSSLRLCGCHPKSGWNALSQKNTTWSFKFLFRSHFLHFIYTLSMWSLTLLANKGVAKHFINTSTVLSLLFTGLPSSLDVSGVKRPTHWVSQLNHSKNIFAGTLDTINTGIFKFQYLLFD